MTRDHDGDTIRRARSGHGARCLWLANGLSDLLVRSALTRRNLLQSLPYLHLKRRPIDIERNAFGRGLSRASHAIEHGAYPNVSRLVVALERRVWEVRPHRALDSGVRRAQLYRADTAVRR